MSQKVKKLISVMPDGLKLAAKTKLGCAYQGDCLALLKAIPDGKINTIFADPPFNVGIDYQNGLTDLLEESKYLVWLKSWIHECVRLLAPGGALLIYHLPKWTGHLLVYLENSGLSFRSLIIHRRSDGSPSIGKLKPQWYPIVYFTKGNPKTFKAPRRKLSTCKRCAKTHKDYGGKAKNLDPRGIETGDVWEDIPAVHSRYKHRSSNELHPWLIDRILGMTTKKGDIILDPFSGSGTTLAVAELRGLYWIGSEIGSCKTIFERLNNLEMDRKLLEKSAENSGCLLTEQDRRRMRKHGISDKHFRKLNGKVSTTKIRIIS